MGGRLTDELRKATRAQSQLHPVDDGQDAGGDGEPADSKMQDCVMSGRKNCAPVDTDSTRGAPSPP